MASDGRVARSPTHPAGAAHRSPDPAPCGVASESGDTRLCGQHSAGSIYTNRLQQRKRRVGEVPSHPGVNTCFTKPQYWRSASCQLYLYTAEAALAFNWPETDPSSDPSHRLLFTVGNWGNLRSRCRRAIRTTRSARQFLRSAHDLRDAATSRDAWQQAGTTGGCVAEGADSANTRVVLGMDRSLCESRQSIASAKLGSQPFPDVPAPAPCGIFGR